METKPLLFGIVGFIIGGFLVSVAAVTFDKPKDDSMTMDDMLASLQDKQGDKYDEAFINEMIDHHQGAIDMAKLSAKQAKHQEIKDLSKAIIEAQEKEIAEMHEWQKKWGYSAGMAESDGM